MKKHDVAVFSPYEFTIGQKIYINSGRRKGDWEVVECDDVKVSLRCPITKKTFQFNRFCYFVKDEKGVVWPHKE